MAGAFIKVDIDDKIVLERLAKLQHLGADLRPAFLDIGKYLERSHRQRWDREVSPDGAKWAALSPWYQAQKAKNADKILVLNAHLRDTLAPQATARSLKFGSNRVYAAVHQFGATAGAFGRSKRGRPIPWGDIPPRPFLGVSTDDEAEILALLREHLTIAGG